MKCPYCSCTLRKKHKYCPECGKVVMRTENEGKKNRKGYVILSVLLAISVLICLALISSRIVEKSKKEKSLLQDSQTTTEQTTTEPTTKPSKPTPNTQKVTTPTLPDVVRNEYDAVEEVQHSPLAKVYVAGGLGLEIEEGMTIEWGEAYVEKRPNVNCWDVTLNGVATGYPKQYSNSTVSKKFTIKTVVTAKGIPTECTVEDQGTV